MDDINRKLLRVLFNASESKQDMKIRDVADLAGLSPRAARERLEDLAEDHLIHLDEANGARTATILAAGRECVRASQITVNNGIVQVGHSNHQVVNLGSDDEADDDDSEADEDDDDDDSEADEDDFDDDE